MTSTRFSCWRFFIYFEVIENMFLSLFIIALIPLISTPVFSLFNSALSKSDFKAALFL